MYSSRISYVYLSSNPIAGPDTDLRSHPLDFDQLASAVTYRTYDMGGQGKELLSRLYSVEANSTEDLQLGLFEDSHFTYADAPSEYYTPNYSDSTAVDKEEHDALQQQTSSSHARNKYIYGALITALVLLSFYVGRFLAPTITEEVRVNPFDEEHARVSVVNDCGGSAAAAPGRGCVFDLMSAAWVDPACLDRGRSDEFLELGNYTYYADANGTVEMSSGEARRGRWGTIWTAGRFRWGHCAYVWSKRFRAVESFPDAAYVDADGWGAGHSTACRQSSMVPDLAYMADPVARVLQNGVVICYKIE